VREGVPKTDAKYSIWTIVLQSSHSDTYNFTEFQLKYHQFTLESYPEITILKKKQRNAENIKIPQLWNICCQRNRKNAIRRRNGRENLESKMMIVTEDGAITRSLRLDSADWCRNTLVHCENSNRLKGERMKKMKVTFWFEFNRTVFVFGYSVANMKKGWNWKRN
jgi:hypothetical protein